MDKMFEIGIIAADILHKGWIQPDFKMENIGDGDGIPVFVDTADCVHFEIPDELNEEFLRIATESILSMIRSIKDIQSISRARAGFIAKGGVLADIIWRNLSNKGMTFLSYKGLTDKSLKYDGADEIGNAINRKRIIEWNGINLDIVNDPKLKNIITYKYADIRSENSSYLKFYIDRLYYINYYNELVKRNDKLIPNLIMNMGTSAFRDDKKYCAFGLLNKCIAISKNNSEIKRMCEKVLNKLIHTKRLSPELKNLILDNLDLEFFEILWLLDDVDTFEKQL